MLMNFTSNIYYKSFIIRFIGIYIISFLYNT